MRTAVSISDTTLALCVSHCCLTADPEIVWTRRRGVCSVTSCLSHRRRDSCGLLCACAEATRHEYWRNRELNRYSDHFGIPPTATLLRSQLLRPDQAGNPLHKARLLIPCVVGEHTEPTQDTAALAAAGNHRWRASQPPARLRPRTGEWSRHVGTHPASRAAGAATAGAAPPTAPPAPSCLCHSSQPRQQQRQRERQACRAGVRIGPAAPAR